MARKAYVRLATAQKGIYCIKYTSINNNSTE